MKSENTGNQRADEHYRDVIEGFLAQKIIPRLYGMAIILRIYLVL